jgi:hypothetical protein
MHEHDADDDYSSTGDPEERSIGPAVFHDTVAVLAPAEPVCLRDGTAVHEAAQRMVHARQAAVLVVDARAGSRASSPSVISSRAWSAAASTRRPPRSRWS